MVAGRTLAGLCPLRPRGGLSVRPVRGLAGPARRSRHPDRRSDGAGSVAVGPGAPIPSAQRGVGAAPLLPRPPDERGGAVLRGGAFRGDGSVPPVGLRPAPRSLPPGAGLVGRLHRSGRFRAGRPDCSAPAGPGSGSRRRRRSVRTVRISVRRTPRPGPARGHAVGACRVGGADRPGHPPAGAGPVAVDRAGAPGPDRGGGRGHRQPLLGRRTGCPGSGGGGRRRDARHRRYRHPQHRNHRAWG